MPKIIEKIKIIEEITPPSMYKVVLHNDDYTTMEFVIMILRTIFHKNEAEAEAIMLQVHEMGIGSCGLFTKEIARTKVNQVKILAKESGFPLLVTAEKDF